MSSSYSSSSSHSGHSSSHGYSGRVGLALLVPVWVFAAFMLAQLIVLLGIKGLSALGVSFAGFDTTVVTAVVNVIIYGLAAALTIGVPWLLLGDRTTRQQLGLHRLPTWMDYLWVIAGVGAYLVLTMVVTTVATHLLPFIDYSQAQNTGFSNLYSNGEYLLAFISLVLVAPVAEETLFRGYLLGKLRSQVPLWLAIVLTSLLFALVHFQWNVGLDVFALSIVLCVLRVKSGSLWAPMLLHMLKNGVAFYFLFINPL